MNKQYNHGLYGALRRPTYKYRALIRNLTILDLKERYQSTILGFFWSIISPFLLALVLYFVFESLFQQEENFALNLLVGIMTWRFFSTGATSSLSVIVGKSNLVTKVLIPRHILVLSNVLSKLISSILEFIVLIPILFVVTGHFHTTTFAFPLIHILYFWLVYGVGLLLAALYVYLRDLNQVWEAFTTALFFLSPIVYPISLVPDELLRYYLLNPLTQLMQMYRAMMIQGDLPSLDSFIVVGFFCVLLFVIGSFVFGRLERRFAEEI